MSTSILNIYDKNIENELSYLALESESQSNVFNIFKDILPILRNKIDGLQSNFLSAEDADKQVYELKKEQQLVIKTFTNKLDFLVYGENWVMVPENFQGSLLAYGEVLFEIINEIYKDTTDILNRYDYLISSFINNKEQRNSLDDYTKFYNDVDKKRKDLVSRLTPFFPLTNNNTRLPLKSVMGRFGELNGIYGNINKITNIHSIKVIKNTDLQCKKVLSKLDTLIELISKDSFNSINPEPAKNIANGAYAVAKLVEFESILFYMTNVYVNCIKHISDDIIEAANSIK